MNSTALYVFKDGWIRKVGEEFFPEYMIPNKEIVLHPDDGSN